MPVETTHLNHPDTGKPSNEMSRREIDQFLTCARVGRVGFVSKDGPYVVPVGFGYSNGEIFFHTCKDGLKMEIIRTNPQVCFEVDEAISDGSLAKSVIIVGQVEVIEEKGKMIPYLQKLIDKYRVQVPFGEYMARGNRNIKEELEKVRICLIAPRRMSGRKLVRTNGNF